MQEEQFILAAKNGDKEAFETLVQHYEKALRGRIMGFVRDYELVEEIYQRTLIQVYNEIVQCEYEKGGFYAFFVNTSTFMIKRHYEDIKKEKILRDSIHKFNSLNKSRSRKTNHEATFEDHDSSDSAYKEKISYKLKQFMEVYDSEKQSAVSAEEEVLSNIEEKTIYDYCFEVLHELGQPHRLMIFLLNKVIYAGKLKNKSGSPKELIKDFAELTLLEMFERTKDEFESVSSLPKLYIDKKFSKLLEKILSEKLEKKKLKEFFGKDPEANVSDWSYRTGKKLKVLLEEKYFREMYEI